MTDIKRLLAWQDHKTGGEFSPEELASSLQGLSIKDLPESLKKETKAYRKMNRSARLRYIELYIFEQTTFALA